YYLIDIHGSQAFFFSQSSFFVGCAKSEPRKWRYRALMLEAIFSHPDFWKYVSIPIVAALVAWATNWIAVQMTFYPIEFFGIRPIFGWQGIIPSKAEKMAGILVDQTLSKIGSIEEFFQQMEPEKIAAHLT